MQIFVPRTKDIGTWYAYVHEGEEHAETAMRNRVGVDGSCSPRKALVAVNRRGIHREEREARLEAFSGSNDRKIGGSQSGS